MITAKPSQSIKLEKDSLLFAGFLLYTIGIYLIIFPFLYINIRPSTLFAFSLGLAFYLSHLSDLFKRSLRPTLFRFVTLIFILGFGQLLLFDTSLDGKAYHLPAAVQFRDGFDLLNQTSRNPWANIYPSGSWKLLAALPKSVFSLKVGFFFNFLVAYINYLLVRVVCANYFKLAEREIFPFAMLIAFSPIVVCQLSSAMNDGLLTSVISACLFLIIIFVTQNDSFSLSALFFSIILMLSIKTSALYYFAFIFLFGFGLLKNLSSTKRRWYFFVITLAFFVGILVNWKPYVTNLIQYRSLMPVDVITGNIPSSVREMNQLSRVLNAIFAETGGNVVDEAVSSLKVPGTFSLHELRSFKEGPRFGGFGPFFSLASLLAVVSFLYFYSVNRKLYKEVRFLVITIIASALCFPESWWARYIGILGVLPVILLLFHTVEGRSLVIFQLNKYIIFLLLTANLAVSVLNWSSANRSLMLLLDCQMMESSPFCSNVLERDLIWVVEARRSNPILEKFIGSNPF